jgi:glycosyltransferase involved in cell wall biosynthesis
MQEGSVDIIHTHGYKADLYGYMAARSTGKPLVATCHNWVGGTTALEIYNRLDRFVLKRFNAIAAVSETVANRMRVLGISPDKIKAIANGLNVEEFEGCSPADLPIREDRDRKVIGIVARLDLQKGFEYLLRAVRDLRKMFPGVILVIVGEGPDRKAIEGMVQEYGLQSNVVLAGQRNDMPGVYAAMDIFVLPSLNEGLPMTLLEAMASSRPVVATRVGAIPSVIADGENGFLVGPRDSAGLKNAISRLLANPDMGRRLGAYAHDWVKQHYTAAAMAQKYRELYEEVLEGRKNAAATAAPRLDRSDVRARSL